MAITETHITEIIKLIKKGEVDKAINLFNANTLKANAATKEEKDRVIAALSKDVFASTLLDEQLRINIAIFLNALNIQREVKAEIDDAKNATPPNESKRTEVPVTPPLPPKANPKPAAPPQTPTQPEPDRSESDKLKGITSQMLGETGWGPFRKKMYESEDALKLLKKLTIDEQVKLFINLMNSNDKQAAPVLFNSLTSKHKISLVNATIKAVMAGNVKAADQLASLMTAGLTIEEKKQILFKLPIEQRGRLLNLMHSYAQREFLESLSNDERKTFIAHVNPDDMSKLLVSLTYYKEGLPLAKKVFAEQNAADSNFQIRNIQELMNSSRFDARNERPEHAAQKFDLAVKLLDQADVSTEDRVRVFNELTIQDAVNIFKATPAGRTNLIESSFDRKLKLLSSESLRDSDGLRLAMFDGLKPEEKDYMISDSRMPEHLSVKFFQSELAKQKDKPEYLKQFFNDMLGAKTTKRALALFNNIKTVDKDGIQVPDYNLQAETLKRLPQHRAADFFRGVKDYNKQAELLMAVESKDPRLAQPLFKRLESAAQQAHVLQKIYTTGNDKSSSAYLSQKLFNDLTDSKNQPNFQQQAKILDEMLDFDVRDKLFKNLAETNPKQAAKVLNQGTLSSLIGNDKKVDLFKTLDPKTQKEVLNAQENGKHHLSDKNSKKLFTAMNTNTKAEHLTDLMKSDLPRPKMLFSSVKAKEQADILAELAKSNNKNNASDLFQSINSTKRQIEILNNLNNPDLRDHLIKSLEPKQAADLFNSAFSTLKDRDAIFSKLVKEDPSRAIQILDSSSSFTGSGKTLFKKYIDSLSGDDAVKEAKNLLSQVKDKKKYFDCLPIPIKMKLGADKSFVSEFGSKNMGGFDQTHNSISLQTCVNKGVPKKEAVQTLVEQPPSQSRPGMSAGI